MIDLADMVEAQLSKDFLENNNILLQNEEYTLRSILNFEACLIQSVDENGKILFTNNKWLDRLGYSKQEMSTLNAFDVVAPSKLEQCQSIFQQLKQSGKPQNVVTQFVTKQGETFPVSGVVEAFVLENGQWITRGFFSDMTEQTQNLYELTKSFDGFDEIAASLSDVFWLMDAKNGNVIYVSPAYEKLWGRKRDSLYANQLEWHQAIHEDDRCRVVDSVEKAIQNSLATDIEFRIVTKEGTVRHIHNRAEPVLDSLGQIVRLAGVATDVTKRKELEANLREVAETDDLTKLMSRKRFKIEAVRILEHARKDTRPVSMALLDLDHFKTLNDNHGHSTGDNVLIHFANVLRNEVRSADIPARIGGDEFCVILDGASVNASKAVMMRVLSSFKKHEILKLYGSSVKDTLTCSIGIAQWNEEESFEDLRDRADNALYEAKNAGRGTIRIT